jgi:hypothetical protein
MARRQRSVWPLLKALALFFAFKLMADAVGLPVVLALASSTPEQAWEAILQIATVVFLLVIHVRFIAFLIGRSAETAVGGFLPARMVHSAGLNGSARQAARSLCGVDADEAEILSKAREIEAGWEASDLRYEDSCRHEAAHAIVAHEFGATVLKAHVDPDGSGQVHWVLPSPRPNGHDEAWMRICIALAGNAQDHLENRQNAGSAKDLQQIMENVAALLSIGQEPPGGGPLSFDGIIGAARQQTREILGRRAKEVNLLARGLEVHGYLPGHQIHADLRTEHEPTKILAGPSEAADRLDAHTTPN